MMIISITAAITAISGFLLGRIGRFPLFALACIVLSLVVSGIALWSGYSLAATGGVFLLALGCAQVGYFLGLLFDTRLRSSRTAALGDEKRDDRRAHAGLDERSGVPNTRG